MIRNAAMVLATLVLVVGCARKPVVREISQLATTSARLPGVNLSDELMKACQVRFDNTELAPKFDFDEAALLPVDRDLLGQLARCVTTGPLAGRDLSLVGRADPRGEAEYNLALGGSRAESVVTYLAHLGVKADRMHATSRGELDAVGADEDGFRRDRRVDISLR